MHFGGSEAPFPPVFLPAFPIIDATDGKRQFYVVNGYVVAQEGEREREMRTVEVCCHFVEIFVVRWSARAYVSGRHRNVLF